jgi:hypothetical protein
MNSDKVIYNKINSLQEKLASQKKNSIKNTLNQSKNDKIELFNKLG